MKGIFGTTRFERGYFYFDISSGREAGGLAGGGKWWAKVGRYFSLHPKVGVGKVLTL